jgi:uncharacterized protein (TIGR04255 family)
LASVAVTKEVIALETTNYEGWSSFKRSFADVLAALGEVSKPDGVLRVGLRYVDEVRVKDGPLDIYDWSEWIDERLVSSFRLLSPDVPLASGTLALQYGDPPGYVTIFRAGPFAGGRTVQEQGTLRMPLATPEGPYFLFDTDSSWAEPSRQIPEFSLDLIDEIAIRLHDPCSDLYEASITEKLRTEVLRGGAASFERRLRRSARAVCP